ncbi:MAG: YihY/virulence factor BrkB family protein [Angustibacter sp.]
MKALLARLKASHAYRSWQRYNDSRGNVLAGGVAYLGFFSIIPALVLGFTVFGFVLRGQPDLFDRVVSYVSRTLPGILKDAAHPDGILDASRPPTPNALSVTGAISLVTLLLSGLGWVDALRQGVRAMFDEPKLKANPVLLKAKDVGVLVTLGLAVLLSAVLSFVVSAATTWVLGLFDAQGSTAGHVLLRVLGTLAVLAADFALMVIVLRLMSGVDLPRSDLAQGALVGAVGLGVLKLASGLLLASASRKPLLAGFAVIIGLLVLMNLISRIMLLAAAWAATTATERGHLPSQAPAPLPRAAGPRDDVLPSFGPRAADRTAVAAGAVLGLTAGVVGHTLRRGLQALVASARGR